MECKRYQMQSRMALFIHQSSQLMIHTITCCRRSKLSTLVRPWEISRYSHINLDVGDGATRVMRSTGKSHYHSPVSAELAELADLFPAPSCPVTSSPPLLPARSDHALRPTSTNISIRFQFNCAPGFRPDHITVRLELGRSF